MAIMKAIVTSATLILVIWYILLFLFVRDPAILSFAKYMLFLGLAWVAQIFEFVRSRGDK